MSRSHIRRQTQASLPIVWWKIALCFAAFVLLFVVVYFVTAWVHSFPSTYETYGKILEIRRVVKGTTDSQLGGTIVYGAEARVQYVSGGQKQDRWLPASDDLSRETLELKLASNPSECLVYWPPKHPENARCSLK
jgi:hypothetical protein